MSQSQLYKIFLIVCLFCIASSSTPIEQLTASSKAFKFTGAEYYLGKTVNSAGDINGDGFDDFIVATYYENSDGGAIYVLYGDSTEVLTSRFSQEFFLNDTIDPSIGFKLIGTQLSLFALSVASAGDINADGYDDIIIGAPIENNRLGAAYILYGANTSNLTSRFVPPLTVDSSLPSNIGFRISGDIESGILGISVASAGDINGDGFDDFIVGASEEKNAAGAVYVFYGAPQSELESRFNTSFNASSIINSTIGFKLLGASQQSTFGEFVASAGDINGDGFDDIIIGAPLENNYMGAAYILYGGSQSALDTRFNSPFNVNLIDSSIGFKLFLPVTYTRFGRSVASAGDINSDGYDDIIIGCDLGDTQGAAYIIYGALNTTLSTRFGSSFDVSAISSDAGFQLVGAASYTNFGISVATAGDINNDGYDDIIIAASYYNLYEGTVYVLYGASNSTLVTIFGSSFTVSLDMDSSIGFALTGASQYTEFGRMVASAGDVNGDGISDIIIGGYSGAYLVYNYSNTPSGGSCPLGTFEDQGVCQDCYPGCNICYSSDSYSCLACGEGVLLEGSCVFACPEGYFSSNQVCIGCSERCSSCSPDGCTSCHWGFILHDGMCVESCPCGFFNDNGVCAECTPGCCSCTSRHSNACIKCSVEFLYEGSCVYPCPENYYNNHGMCEPCSAGCSSCVSSSSCTACSSGFLWSGSCVSSCPQGYFSLNQVCVGCNERCSSCSADGCTACNWGLLLHDGMCIESCPCGFFNDNGVCTECTPGCDSCTSRHSNACTKCSVEFLYEGSCVYPCPENYYNNNGVCEPCSAGCSSCVSASPYSCTECSSGVLFGGSCVEVCPEHYIGVDGVCQVANQEL